MKKRIKKILRAPQKFVVRRLLHGAIIRIEDGPEYKDYKIARAVQEEEYIDIYTDSYLWSIVPKKEQK